MHLDRMVMRRRETLERAVRADGGLGVASVRRLRLVPPRRRRRRRAEGKEGGRGADDEAAASGRETKGGGDDDECCAVCVESLEVFSSGAFG